MNRIDLNRCDNKACYGNCNKDDRRHCAENDLCRVGKSNLDSLSVRCVGDWAEEKIYLLYQYFGIFTKGMKNKWTEINYIEICSNIPFFFKQWGTWSKDGKRGNKKSNGKVLQGQIVQNMPEVW